MGKEAVLGANVVLTASTKIIDVSSEEPKEFKRLGFMLGEGKVPDNFNSMGSSEIESMFYENK